MVDKTIQSGQAFLVQTTTTSPSIQFTEFNKTETNISVFRESNLKAKLSAQLLLNLEGGNCNTADGFTVVFGEKF